MNHRAIIGTLGFGFVLCSVATADVYVRGHTRKDGTYVKGHYRSNPDGKFGNNWSTLGNTNPYTGKRGWLKQPSSGRSSSYYVPGDVYRTPTQKLNEVTSPESERQRGTVSVNDSLAYSDEEKAASKLTLAITCTRLGKVDDARIWLRQVIAEYPQTTAASRARELLTAGFTP